MLGLIYILLPLLLLGLCARFKPEIAWLLIPLCPVLDILLYRTEFAYYEARVFFVLFTCIQAVAVALAVILITRLRKCTHFLSRLFGALTTLTATLMVLIIGMEYQHHAYFSYLNSAPTTVTMLHAIPFIPFLALFSALALRFRRTESP